MRVGRQFVAQFQFGTEKRADGIAPWRDDFAWHMINRGLCGLRIASQIVESIPVRDIVTGWKRCLTDQIADAPPADVIDRKCYEAGLIQIKADDDGWNRRLCGRVTAEADRQYAHTLHEFH